MRKNNAIDAVEHVIKVMSRHSHAVVISDDCICAEVVADVAADWVSRLLGDAHTVHLASCRDTAEANAVHLIV